MVLDGTLGHKQTGTIGTTSWDDVSLSCMHEVYIQYISTAHPIYYIHTTYVQYTHYIHHPPVRASFMVTSGSSTKGSITPGCEEQLKHQSVSICLQVCIHMHIHKCLFTTYTDTHLHISMHTHIHTHASKHAHTHTHQECPQDKQEDLYIPTKTEESSIISYAYIPIL